MTNQELDEKILEALKMPHNSQVSASTSLICNHVFQVERNGNLIRPGDDKMKWVYSRLSSLSKRKKVAGGCGIWKLLNETGNP